MKVKYLVGASGPGVIIRPGDEVEVTKANGQRLIDKGLAEEVKPKRTSGKKKADGDN